MPRTRPIPTASGNPFRYQGPLGGRSDVIDRAAELEQMTNYVRAGHSLRMIGPRRYGKTTLLKQVLADVKGWGMAGALVDVEDVLSIGELVVRIERAYAASLQGKLKTAVEALFNAWDVGLSLGAGGFTARLARRPETKSETVLLRLLDLPSELHKRTGERTLVVFDEIQDILAIPGADGKIRSVIQHHEGIASYAFAGSAPGTMEQLFARPERPLLEQAVGFELAPLPLDDVAQYITRRFRSTNRNVGDALPALLQFTRGHPMRTMMFAHYLWQHTGSGHTATEETFVAAQEDALRQASPHLRAIFKALTPNEKRVVVALANLAGSPRERANATVVGLKGGSVTSATDQLLAKADLRTDDDDGLEITDPLFELWLKRRGLAGVGRSNNAE